jgi:hypothetical protein
MSREIYRVSGRSALFGTSWDVVRDSDKHVVGTFHSFTAALLHRRDLHIAELPA